MVVLGGISIVLDGISLKGVVMCSDKGSDKSNQIDVLSLLIGIAIGVVVLLALSETLPFSPSANVFRGENLLIVKVSRAGDHWIGAISNDDPGTRCLSVSDYLNQKYDPEWEEKKERERAEIESIMEKFATIKSNDPRDLVDVPVP
jgi:hypothetical protein